MKLKGPGPFICREVVRLKGPGPFICRTLYLPWTFLCCEIKGSWTFFGPFTCSSLLDGLLDLAFDLIKRAEEPVVFLGWDLCGGGVELTRPPIDLFAGHLGRRFLDDQFLPVAPI